jgi:ribosome recycling factor
MEEEISFYLDDAKESMEKAIQHTAFEFNKIRAGKASPVMLEGIKVVYYGSPTPLTQVANVSAPEPRMIIIKPWERNIIPEIEKSIRNSDLGLNPQNDGEMIRIPIPPLSGERRQELVKKAKNETENGKIRVRKIRQETNDALRKLVKEGASEDTVKKAEQTVQELTDKGIKKLDEMLVAKETDIMTI